MEYIVLIWNAYDGTKISNFEKVLKIVFSIKGFCRKKSLNLGKADLSEYFS